MGIAYGAQAFLTIQEGLVFNQTVLAIRCEHGKDLARALVVCGEWRISILIQRTVIENSSSNLNINQPCLQRRQNHNSTQGNLNDA